ncbi:hypothetical protein BATDEDRAFT_34938 [Batrachochytrium dendrobatidis JAM81]|uniref:CS domain-containing protein n=2 Tax=Batrachochytrium dendrobatidis TaxID=109871 RepID=F4P1E6_BATDJ|nr:Hsp90 cochaperone SBA1 [Batrachochytrium dendrobatidis JAM81]EGF80894.1 hypothetical protein BATDEDRAFT_34938 [Batrachochytrium dendrobatidis JAM81]|eukprot:XP_006678567.1 hypothetical protein BATDEDRAFT_34938 [Batrachochytrium dendrobatidis JAM81]
MSTGTITRAPEVMWAQDRKSVFLTIRLVDVQSPVITKSADSLTFEAVVGGQTYGFHLDLFSTVKSDSWHETITNRSISLVVEKENTNDRFWPRLQKASVKLPWLKTDFSKFVDDTFDDPEPVEAAMDAPPGMGGMNEEMLKMFAQAGGAGGGAGGMPTFEDSDDEELAEDEKDIKA